MDSVTFISTHNSPICAEEVLSLTASSTDTASTYTWVGPSGFNSSLDSPSLYNTTASSSGSYYLTNRLFGCVEKDTLQVLVKPLPNKPWTTTNSPICEEDSLGLMTNSSTSGVSYSWAGANGFISSTQSPHILNATTNATGMYVAGMTPYL